MSRRAGGVLLPALALLAALAMSCTLSLSFVNTPATNGLAGAPPALSLRRGAVNTAQNDGRVGATAWAAVATGALMLAAAANRLPRTAQKAAKGDEDSVASRAVVEKEEEEEVFDPSKQPGATLPLMYFDPAGFCKKGDYQTFYNYRSAELKHGRIGMIAALGALLQHWFRFPGFEEVPAGVYAVTTPPGTYGLVAIILAAGAVELTVGKQDPEKGPGDFGDPLGIGQTYDEWKHRELNNGRMGMLSIMGIVAAELATGRDALEQVWQPLANLPVE